MREMTMNALSNYLAGRLDAYAGAYGLLAGFLESMGGTTPEQRQRIKAILARAESLIAAPAEARP